MCSEYANEWLEWETLTKMGIGGLEEPLKASYWSPIPGIHSELPFEYCAGIYCVFGVSFEVST